MARLPDVLQSFAAHVYEVDQKFELRTPQGVSGVNVDPIANDFSNVASFILNITCSLDSELIQRLTQLDSPPVFVRQPPKEFVPRVFDKRILGTTDDVSQLSGFMTDLIGLERKTYSRVMRAIRRYITGLHRVGDDLTLAYTLLVASMESLSAEFDKFSVSWQDYELKKRQRIDRSLNAATEELKASVRSAVLDIEHIALRRRFEEFVIDHIEQSFYRSEAIGVLNPLRSVDLRAGLKAAYVTRSKAVHELIELPRLMSLGAWASETLNIDGSPMLTLAGLSRLARHVIKTYVMRARKVETEKFEWWRDLPNIVQAQAAPRYWIWNPDGFDHKSAPKYLTGFLQELAECHLQQPGAGVPDMQRIVERVDLLISGLTKPKQRLPMIALCYLFHWYAARDRWPPMLEKLASELDNSSIESMIVHVLTSQETGWTIQEFETAREHYMLQRNHKLGVTLPPLYECAMSLTLAEQFRSAGNIERASELIRDSVDSLPGNQGLMEFEISFDTHQSAINWQALLIPSVTTTSASPPLNEPEVMDDWQIESTAENDSSAHHLLRNPTSLQSARFATACTAETCFLA